MCCRRAGFTQMIEINLLPEELRLKAKSGVSFNLKDMDPKKDSTEERILEAAKTVFIAKGMEGARMQEIADEAGINKSLLHYYFRNKETLFKAVFQNAVKDLMPAILTVITSEKPLLQKIEEFMALHIGFIHSNPLVPLFLISETMRNPNRVLDGFRTTVDPAMTSRFKEEIRRNVEAGTIRPIDPYQLIINMLSLSVFPSIARPILSGFFNLSDEEYDELLRKRKTNVSEFIINSLRCQD